MAVPESLAAQERLQKINEEIYKRNAELAVKNKTLSLLRQLYEITTLTLEPDDLAHKLVESIQKALNFKLVSILKIDEDTQTLVPFATSGFSHEEYSKIAIPLSSQKNICAVALRTRQKKQTEKFFDVAAPFLSESAISAIQKDARIQTSLIYPLLTENKKLGVLLFVLSRKAKDLSFFEKESIASLVNVVAIALDKALLYEALTNLTRELETANVKLKKLDKAKSEFISIASHQLRTPLTAIKGYLSLVLEDTYGKVEDAIRKPLGNVYISNERLIRLVNDLLSISRIESGKIKLELGKTNIKEMAESVIAELRIKAQEKKLQLILEPVDSSITEVQIDEEKMRNVVLNIIDNAIRYTRQGSITTKIEKVNKKLHISITDTGEGMSKEEISGLFQSFTRGTAGAKLSTEGAGLGLYIAKQFVEMHHGKVWAESKGKGKGSTFHIEVPFL